MALLYKGLLDASLAAFCSLTRVHVCRLVAKGAVAEQGTHQQLLEAGGAYSALVRRQLQKTDSSASLSSVARDASARAPLFV